MLNIVKRFNHYYLFVILILAVMFLMMLFSALGDSGTMDELAHIPAAYSYLKYQDMRLNPEHPPLLKDLAGLPLQFLNLNFPVDHQAWQSDINGQWWAGSLFLYESGNNPDKILFWARLGPMLLTILLGFFIFKWSRELFGPLAALLTAIFYAFSPTILAHGRLVTTDVAAAFGIIIGTYYFLKWLKNQTNKNLIIAGLAFGLAQLLKFSDFLLIPFFVLLGFIWVLIYSSFKIKPLVKSTLKTLGETFLIFAIGYIFIVWPVYGFHTLNYPPEKQQRDTQYILTSYGNGQSGLETACLKLSQIKRCPAELTIWMSNKPYFKSFAHYLLGLLMVFQRQSGGNTGYFLGEISAAGWWYYFPVVYLIKEQLALHLLTIASLIFLIALTFKEEKIVFASLNLKTRWEKTKENLKLFKELIKENFEVFAMIVFIAVYFYISIRGNLNIGVRHLIPSTILIYILTAGGLSKWINAAKEIVSHPPDKKQVSYLLRLKEEIKGEITKLQKQIIAILLFIWYIAGAAFIFPHFLSYFNELVGSKDGYKFVVDSNYDWGQDLKRLAKWVNDNHLESIGIHYFGAGKPEYYIKNAEVLWWWDVDKIKASKFKSLKVESELPKYFAISATFAQYANGTPVPGFNRQYEPWFDWVQNKKPVARAGYSIFIYELK